MDTTFLEQGIAYDNKCDLSTTWERSSVLSALYSLVHNILIGLTRNSGSHTSVKMADNSGQSRVKLVTKTTCQ